MKILITGGAGFIGAHLALRLLNEHHEVSVLDNLESQVHGLSKKSYTYLLIKDKVEFINADIRDDNVVSKAISDVDVLVHLAALTGTGQSMYQISRYVDVNVNGTAKLLQALINTKNKINKVIVASSRAIYGEGKYLCKEHGAVYPSSRTEENMKKGNYEPVCPICFENIVVLATDEQSIINPGSIYGITKYNQEELVIKTTRAIGIPALAYRFQNVYGPGQSLSNPYTGILSIFSTAIMNNNDINIYEDGLESRDFVHVDDVVGAVVAGIEDKNDSQIALNVGSGDRFTVLDIVNELEKALGRRSSYKITGDYRLGDIRHNYSDNRLLAETLDYIPTIKFEEGLKQYLEWVQNQGTMVDHYQEAEKEIKSKGMLRQSKHRNE